ncbi:phenylalanyl-tRNA synthetase alpha subunit, mitochondrial [Dispira simplex]|nr:phenylalanyl-tRNA synthetase alpha subunit, mitochondrial [Dispira simplex]
MTGRWSTIPIRSCTNAASDVACATDSKPASAAITLAYPRDDYTNCTPSILDKVDRQLHLNPAHPLGILKHLIFDQFPGYAQLDTLSPVVSTQANFDSLLIPADHPSRSKHDAYYLNRTTMLRSHTSAHQVEVMRQAQHKAFLVAADVYRRDEIDASHYPVFHQMEAVRLFSPQDIKAGTIEREIDRMKARIQEVGVISTDDSLLDQQVQRTTALQPEHDPRTVALVTEHIKTSLNYWVAGIFGRIQHLQPTTENKSSKIPVRWIEGNFPFTTPSWEMEVMFQENWLEICGCGVMKQQLLRDAGLDDHIGWAAGFGLERLAMVLFDIPDIRLFWSQDPRFHCQFQPGQITRFVPFSKYPPCLKDISFWLPTPASFHENDFMDVVRDVAQDLVEDVKLVDRFVHPKTQRTSLCYRIVYRSMDRSFTNDEINEVQEKLRHEVTQRLGVSLR